MAGIWALRGAERNDEGPLEASASQQAGVRAGLALFHAVLAGSAESRLE
jgi:hypothetical protein